MYPACVRPVAECGGGRLALRSCRIAPTTLARATACSSGSSSRRWQWLMGLTHRLTGRTPTEPACADVLIRPRTGFTMRIAPGQPRAGLGRTGASTRVTPYITHEPGLVSEHDCLSIATDRNSRESAAGATVRALPCPRHTVVIEMRPWRIPARRRSCSFMREGRKRCNDWILSQS